MKTGFSLFMAVILLTGIAGAQEKSGSNEAIFNFTVTSKRGKPRQGELIMLKSQKTKRVYKASTGSDGKCSVSIPTSDNYTIYYKLFADTVKYKQIDVPGEEHKVVYTLTLKYDPRKHTPLRMCFSKPAFLP